MTFLGFSCKYRTHFWNSLAGQHFFPFCMQPDIADSSSFLTPKKNSQRVRAAHGGVECV